jgi:hypothetical protein
MEQVITATRRLPTTFVLSGGGEFLARQLISDLTPPAKVVSLRTEIGGKASECAPAHALAVLTAENSHHLSQ